MKVIRAKHAGFCYGVQRAARIASELLHSGRKPIFTIGPLIHNPQEVARLASLGILPREHIEDCVGAPTLIRTHGISIGEVRRAAEIGVELIDATCPHVKASRQYIGEFGRAGRTVLLFGDEGHPEVKALLSYAQGPIHVVRALTDLIELSPDTPIGIVAQTTASSEAFEEIVEVVSRRHSHTTTVNTICEDTERRRAESRLLAATVDAMVVVGGKNSANTRRLVDLCRTIQPRTFGVEVAAELEEKQFLTIDSVGLTSGASTPEWIISDVEGWLRTKSRS
jgi:(E)-4-hydroxy-3-methyl-but-2-enyl pyrophosphate reductase (IPP and DMAPP forming)